MKNWKQIVAALGAAVLIGTSVGSVPQVVYAETSSEAGDTEETEVKTEPEETKEPEEEDKKGKDEAEKEKEPEETKSEIKDETKKETVVTPKVTEQPEVKDETKKETAVTPEVTEQPTVNNETKEEVVKTPEVTEQPEVKNETQKKIMKAPTVTTQPAVVNEENGIMLLSDGVEIGGTETSEPGTATGSITDGEDSSATVVYTGSWEDTKVSVGGSYVAPTEIVDKETGDPIGMSYSEYDTDDYTVKAVFDLSYLVDGDKAEPEDPVTVSIDSWRLNSMSMGNAVTIYHIKDNGRKEIVAMNAAVKDGEQPMSGKVTFTTSSFSPFLLTDDSIDDIYIDATDATIKKTGEIQAHILQHTGDDADEFNVNGYGKGWKDITERILATDGLTFTWTKTDANKNAVDIEKAAISDDKGQVLLVKDSDDDLGNGKLYTFTIADQSGNELTSEPATVKYYKSFLNSSFEEPSIGSSSWSGVAMDRTKWTTTDSQGKVELGIYSNTGYDAHGAGLDYYNQNTNGLQYAELNANSAGTLYQDVLTYGNTDLSWSLLHRARTARKPTMKVGDTSTVTDNMYAVIMSKDDAEQVSASQADIEAMITDVAQDGKAHDYAVPGTDKKVKVTVWKISTKTTTEKTADGAINSSAKGDEDSLTGTYSDTTGWAQYKGSYTVPEGQYLTRFFFVAGATGNNNKAVGNLLDEVYFAQAIPVSVKGTINWVDHDDEDGIRPDDLTVTVYDNNGKAVGTAKITIDENGNWTYSLNDLDQYDDDGNEIKYTVKVTSVDGYEAEIKETENGTVITMTHEPETTVSGEITWVDNSDKYGIRPETVEIQLLDKDGKPVTDSEGNPITTTAKVDENGNYTYSFDELPKYDEDGNEIKYTVKPIVPGYKIETEPNGKGGFDITCTLNKDNDDYKNYFPAEDPYMWILVDPPVEKAIEGDEPSSDTTFTFELVPYSVELTDGTEMLVKEMPLPTSLTGEANHTVVTIKGEGQDEFGNFRFNHPGTYVYHVTERNDNVERYTYDDATYVVTFAVKYDEVDGWTCVRTIQRNGKGEDTGICTFTNTYKAPASNNNNDDNDSKSSGKHDGGKYAKVDFYLVDDANTQPLSSGVFALYTSAGELIGTYTTDAAGHIQFPNLKGGSYYLVQLSAPNGYELNGTRVNFTVDGTPLALMLTDKAAGAATSAVDTAATVAPSDAAAADAATAGPGTENGAAVGGATGDESNMVLYGAATGAAAILLAVWFVMNRRRVGG